MKVVLIIKYYIDYSLELEEIIGGEATRKIDLYD